MIIRKKIILYIILIISTRAGAQQIIRGLVTDSSSLQPIEGVTVTLLPSRTSAVTNSNGVFIFKTNMANIASLSFSSIDYGLKTVPLKEFAVNNNTVRLSQQTIELSSVTVSSHAGNQYQIISRADIAMRGVTNSQEVLRIIPGLFIGQHQGGGKAEQIFLRGFDNDHGTDIGLFADGMPVNMVSHAHGQGYADSHFIIPETINDVVFKKGMYYADKGDFTTTGYADYQTKNVLDNNLVKIEGGMFNTVRALGMFNLLGEKAKARQQSWYVASEYRYTDAYFDNPQHFNRFNFFTKYAGKISGNTNLYISASYLWSKWKASGQIPEEAVDEGLIGFYGAVDPNEGGNTTRTNVNAQFTTSLNNGDVIKNQLYYTHYTFNLNSNFTFFLEDSVNGDEIRQQESRNMIGYNGSYNHVGYIGGTRLTTDAGINVRLDATRNSALSHTVNNTTLINRIKLGDINELSLSPYISETFHFNERFSMNAGLRFDQFFFQYNNKYAGDTTLPGTGIYKANANVLSPKLSFYYHANNTTEFYLTAGRGFHSNDARSAVVVDGADVLPKAYGADLGTVIKPVKNLLINAALWWSYLTQENVYGGDGGSVEFSGPTRRMGFDFSGRYQPLRSLYMDVDVNYAHGRSVNDAKGENYIPLAPVWSSTGGITYSNKNGLNGSLRYRYLANRPANEDYSLTAEGYFITDAVFNYTKRKYEIGVTINNIFNTKWKETQFDTEYRLKTDATAVDGICFTPGTPFALTAHVSVFF
ncbi:TonB-dependent receptor [Parafilimonas sp.]|uniref:TonB-dependent receptor n=1 Tax=Parafilimonas sp. TaxID=1969739 RepID=UPI0039E62816